MKRAGIKPGAKSLARGATFNPPTQAKPRRRKKPRGPGEREASEAWARGVRSKRCVVCNAEHPKGHHIITQQRLKAKARELGIPAAKLLWDARNRLAVCDRHHNAHHHSRAKPLTWEVLQQHAPKVFQFARELNLEPWLERTYPRSTQREEHPA